MLRFTNDKIVFYYNYCQQCGACFSSCPKKAISFVQLSNGLQKIEINEDMCILCKKCINICPANRVQHVQDYFSPLANRSYYLASNKNLKIRSESSSGGVCKTLIIEGLKSNKIDAAYSLKKTDNYPCAIGEYYTKDNIPGYDTIPNSVYHSIMACKELGKVTKTGRLMIVGTSCQLYAMEKALTGKCEDFIKVCIFCKQQKTFQCTEWFAKVVGEQISDRHSIKAVYRGEGWPGIVRIMNGSLAWEKAAGLPFGRRLWCVPGCDICGDPFGMEVGADLTLMDPWKISKPNDFGETLVCAHTQKGIDFLLSIGNLAVTQKDYTCIKPALGEIDIKMKRQLIPFFKGEKVPEEISKAGKEEVKQRNQLEHLLEITPRLPFFFYRLLNKIYPKKRDLILKGRENEY